MSISEINEPGSPTRSAIAITASGVMFSLLINAYLESCAGFHPAC